MVGSPTEGLITGLEWVRKFCGGRTVGCRSLVTNMPWVRKRWAILRACVITVTTASRSSTSTSRDRAWITLRSHPPVILAANTAEGSVVRVHQSRLLWRAFGILCSKTVFGLIVIVTG